MSISTETKWVATDGWRGYSEPIHAVGGVNDTGGWSDSPCPTEKVTKELEDFKQKLRKAGIKYRTQVTESSNVFCQHIYVLVAPEDHAKAYEIAVDHRNNTTWFYPVKQED